MMNSQRIMNAHIFFEKGPQLFLYFWRVLNTENTVRLFKKSKRSILFDANRKKNSKKKISSEAKTGPCTQSYDYKNVENHSFYSYLMIHKL